MGIDISGRVNPHHLRQKCVIVMDEFCRNDTGADDFLPVINIVQKGVYCAHALANAIFQPPPFLAGNNAWHHVKWNKPFNPVAIAINIKGNANATKNILRAVGLTAQLRQFLIVQPILQLVVGCTQ